MRPRGELDPPWAKALELAMFFVAVVVLSFLLMLPLVGRAAWFWSGSLDSGTVRIPGIGWIVVLVVLAGAAALAYRMRRLWRRVR